ncbi:hypothetical protein GCM10027419_04860 [Pandoraea terrae]
MARGLPNRAFTLSTWGQNAKEQAEQAQCIPPARPWGAVTGSEERSVHQEKRGFLTRANGRTRRAIHKAASPEVCWEKF